MKNQTFILVTLVAFLLGFASKACKEVAPVCGEIDQQAEIALKTDSNLLITWARLQYNCVTEEWDGQIIVDSSQSIMVSHKVQLEVTETLKDATSNFIDKDLARIDIDIHK